MNSFEPLKAKGGFELYVYYLLVLVRLVIEAVHSSRRHQVLVGITLFYVAFINVIPIRPTCAAFFCHFILQGLLREK